MSSLINGKPRFAYDLGLDIGDHVPFHVSLRTLLVTYSEPKGAQKLHPGEKIF